MEGLLKKIFLFVFIVGFVGSVNPVGIDAASYKECSWGDTGDADGYCFTSSCPSGYSRYKDGESNKGGRCDRDVKPKEVCCKFSKPFLSECNPLPDPCGKAAGCVEGTVCVWLWDPTGAVGGTRWHCESDDHHNKCNVNNCSGECFEKGCDVNNGWMRNQTESCGVEGMVCCNRIEQDCPGSCKKSPTLLPGQQYKLCPEGYTSIPGKCPSGLNCCRNDNPDAKEEEDDDRPAWANEYEPPDRKITEEYEDEDPPEIGGLGGIVTEVINYLFPLAGFICLIFIIQGGYMWIVSAGNPESVRKAQGTLTWAIIGLVLTMTVFAILTVLLKFLYK